MRYPPHILEEIRARLPISAVVGRKVRLKKAGREWRGLSPFNAEKTPSFYANDQKQFYHCFSSGKHGDIFTFLIETEGLSFPDAVERLAAEAGVELPKLTPEREAAVEQRRSLFDVLDLACRYFESQLLGAAGREARAYLERRQVAAATQAEFRIGYAPDGRTALLEHLRGKGVEDDLILRAGLAVRPDDGRGLYDRFRGRVVFPIQDTRGQVVAFGGRAMADAVQPKYLNSPETELFHKGRIVFNGNRARAAAHRGEPLAVVEGYLDAIAAWQAGHKAVVATLGTAFTEEQIEALWQVSGEPILCLDGDKAGRAAAFRALDRMLPLVKVGKSFRFAFLPDGQDPDDLIRQKGLAGFRRQLEDAAKLWDVLWQRESGSLDASDPDAIARLDQTLRALIGEMGDPQLRYRYELTAKLSIRELSWRATRKRFHDRRPDVSFESMLRTSRLFAGGPTRLVGIERILLGLCVEFPDFAAQASDDLYRIRFRGTQSLPDGGDLSFQAFFDAMMSIIGDEPKLETADVHRRINPVFSALLDVLHGREEEGRSSGGGLRQLFPVLRYVFDEEYFSRCFWNFINILIARELEDELHETLGDSADPDSVGDIDRLTTIQSEIHMRRERFTAEENELAELASVYRPARAA